MITRAAPFRALVALCVVVSCVTPPRPAPVRLAPNDAVVRLERQVALAEPGAAGRLALARWAVSGQRTKSLAEAEAVLAAAPADASALAVKLFVASENLDDPTAAAAALSILRHAPTHPLAELAAARLARQLLDRPDVDASIIEALRGLAAGSIGLSGKAAVRAREVLANTYEGHNADADAAAVRKATGVITGWTVYGPLSALRLAGFAEAPVVAEAAAPLPVSVNGPLGPVKPRTFETPSGVLSLSFDPWKADVYEAFADIQVPSAGLHLVSLRGAALATLWVDGVEVLRRRPLPRRAPDRSWGAVDLPAGPHRLRLRLARIDTGTFSVALSRADGAPAALSPVAASGAPAATAAETRVRAVPLPPGAVEWAADHEGFVDPGRALVHAHLLRADDVEAARAALGLLDAVTGGSIAYRSLAADLWTAHPDLPREAIASRVADEWERVLAVDPAHPRALIARAEAERSDKRWDDVAARLPKLEAALGSESSRFLLFSARVALGRDDRDGAGKLADKALGALAGWCDALELRYDLARRADEILIADRLAPSLDACPGGLASRAGHHRERGRLDLARPLLERLVARDPQGFSARQSLSDLLVALGAADDARAAIAPLVTAWPWSEQPLLRLAALEELQDRKPAAAELRAKALALSGDDVGLARVVALDAGADLLDRDRRDGLAVIAAFKASGFTADAPAIQVLDSGVLQVEPGGRWVERIHSIVQVLDKRGIDRFGEVSIPGDGQALIVRAIKPDGTLREAENIAGKDAISLPGLEPGDFVEYEFLHAQEAAPPSQGGWMGGAFTFRGPELPFFESTYRVRVHASLGLTLDVANFTADPVTKDGDWLVFEHSERKVEAWVPEPMSVPESELLPWVQAGNGPTLEDDVRQRADWQALRLRITPEVDALVDDLHALPQPEQVRRLLARINERVPGDGPMSDFSQSAPSILAAKRGNRAVVLATALEALGIEARFVVARPFTASRHAFKFTRNESIAITALRVRLADGTFLWFDTGSRFAPFGRLPGAMSGLEGFVVPRVGEQVAPVVLPVVDRTLDRSESDVSLAIDAEGGATGEVVIRSFGYSAAFGRQVVERSNPDEYRKAFERVLSRALRGVELVSLEPRDSGDLEQPFVVASAVHVPRFVRPGRVAGTFEAPATAQPFRLGPQFLAKGERKTPLVLGSSISTRQSLRLAPPKGARLAPPADVALTGAFGRYSMASRLDVDGTLVLEETLDLDRQRVAPADYPAFRDFIAGIDAAQARPVVLEPSAPAAPATPPPAAPTAP